MTTIKGRFIGHVDVLISVYSWSGRRFRLDLPPLGGDQVRARFSGIQDWASVGLVDEVAYSS